MASLNYDDLPEDEVPLILCSKEVADKWIKESESLGISPDNYTYHDSTLWKVKNKKIPKNKITIDDLMLF